ncbi:serine/threonine-protein kinase [Micromonospora azadirachtae]|uniref:Serine/threonine-protein kinase n=1 Tax=Micromonospora azadirachtae TaxID=1970735 RepID=A0ABW2ZWR4_9ACTN
MTLQGERLDRPTYKVIQTITEGSTAVCYRAFHDVFHRYVVQKTVSLLGLDDALAYSEPRLLKEIRHKHIVEVWEAQWDPDPALRDLKAVTFVMPFYEGGSITGALLDGYRFSIGEAVGIARGMLDALHHLHVERRLLHRDVKPGNVMLDDARTHAHVGDLGSAARMNDSGEADVRSGTPLYRPPESHLGRYTRRGDIYGVGMTLLECLNGPHPYADLDLDDVDDRLAQGRPPVPARMLKPGPHVPPPLARIVKRLIDPDPSRRPTAALDAQRLLEHVTHMDWRERADGDARVWDGRWPPAARPGQGRKYEVRAAPIKRGLYAGKLLLTARWCSAGSSTWRQLKSLERRALPNDAAALAAFFRDVEAAAAQNVAAR